MRIISTVSVKTLVAGGAVLATLGAGAVAAQASFTEDSFGQAVKAQVAACKASAARLNEHGIGECVSTWVRANNPSERNEASPEPSESPEPEDAPRPHPSLSPRPHPSESPEIEDRNEHESRPSPSTGAIHIVRPTGDGHRH